MSRWDDRGGLAAIALRLIVPSTCATCGEPRSGLFGAGVCEACWSALTPLPLDRQCPTCAIPSGGEPCRDCVARRPPVTRAVTFGLYQGLLSRLVVAFKFHGFDLLAPRTARLLRGVVREAGLETAHDAVVPIPSTRGRNRERGYDPADLLAREVCRSSRIPLSRVLSRTRETAPQSSLPAGLRSANVAGAFAARGLVAGRRLLLLDDVVTTGATAFSAARALLQAGAARVDLLVLARTPIPSASLAVETT